MCVYQECVRLPWQSHGDCIGKKTLPCFSVTHTLKMHLTLEVGVCHTSSNCLLPAWWGWRGSRDSTPTVTGVSPDPTGKGLCPTRLPPLQRPTARSKLGTHPSSLDQPAINQGSQDPSWLRHLLEQLSELRGTLTHTFASLLYDKGYR